MSEQNRMRICELEQIQKYEDNVKRLQVKCESLRQANEAQRENIASLEAKLENRLDIIRLRDREMAEYATRIIELETGAAELKNRLEAYQVNSEDVIRDKQSKIDMIQYELDIQKALVKALKEVFVLKI